MAYLFRCDVCFDEQPIEEGEGFDCHRNCEDCGMDGCSVCLAMNLCEDCELEQQQAKDEEEGVE